MKASSLINAILSPLNVKIIKRSSLQRLDQELARLRQNLAEASNSESSLEEIEKELIRGQIFQKWSLLDNLKITAEKQIRCCPLCLNEFCDSEFGKVRSHCIFGGGELVRHTCPSCNVIFGPDKMFNLTEDQLAEDYEWHYKVYQEGDSTEAELRAFYSLNPSKQGIYLNYGAGSWSRSVQKLREEGWNVYAFEPHSSAANNLDFLISSNDQLEKMKFDGIFSNNVLEHFRHPVRELSAMSNRLKPCGVMAHATPCFDYLYEYTRFHLFFFAKKSRHILLEKCSLKEIDFISDGEFMCSVVSPYDC